MNVCTCYTIRVCWTTTKCKSLVFLVLNQLMWTKLSYCVSLSFSDTRCKHTNSCFAFLSTVILKEFSLVFASFCCVNSSVHVRFVFDGALLSFTSSKIRQHVCTFSQSFKFLNSSWLVFLFFFFFQNKRRRASASCFNNKEQNVSRGLREGAKYEEKSSYSDAIEQIAGLEKW